MTNEREREIKESLREIRRHIKALTMAVEDLFEALGSDRIDEVEREPGSPERAPR